MGIFRKTKGIAGSIIDIRVDRWMSLDYISETTSRFKGIIKDTFTPQKASRSETFEQALKRLELTEDDINDRKREFKRLVATFLAISLAVICYGFYLALTGNVFSAFVTLALSLFSLSQAFKYHFWLFQIKHRKLGCTLKEWFNDKVFEDITNEDTKTEK
jgi:intracellular multiplication protein IcmV